MVQPRSSAEIVEFIDLMISGMLERPEMYADSPEGLEGIFHNLETIRAYAATGNRISHYPDCLIEAGLGNCTFSMRAALDRGENPRHAARQEFQPLVEFLKSYLVRENRWPINVKTPEQLSFLTPPGSPTP